MRKKVIFTWLLLLISLISLTNNLKAQENSINKSDLIKIKQQIVKAINENRLSSGLNPLELDELASQVGEQHCQEMLSENYFSHWNIAGLKPYMRYSQASGIDAISENLSFSEGGVYLNSVERLRGVLVEMHTHMFNEEPPNDGHRKNILDPHHTHVGIGIVFNENQVKLAEEFISHYVEIRPLPHKVKPGEQIEIKGKVLNPKEYEIARISIFSEPLPTMLTREELNHRGSYSLPEKEDTVLRPILSGNAIYKDDSNGSKLSKGEIEYEKFSGKFSARYSFPKNSKGVYTVVIWVKKQESKQESKQKNKQEEKFPVTNISFELQ